VQRRVIDGHDWIERRLAHLREGLTGDLSEDEANRRG
jgi:hypothetical protein